MPVEQIIAHGWRLEVAREAPAGLASDFLCPAARALPAALAARLGPCRISVVRALEQPEITSRWRRGPGQIEITVAFGELEPHDVAVELLLCLGQLLWEVTTEEERAAWLEQLRREIEAGVPGEIDEQALEAKQRLLAGTASARSRRRLEDYACASFAGTAAEYVHCLWHDVTIRTGPEHLPARWLRARLELLARWFPPNRGYRLFADKEELQRGTGNAGPSDPSPA